MSRKLGTLTLDLIAKIGGFEQGMDKARRKSKSTMQSIEKGANLAGKGCGGYRRCGGGLRCCNDQVTGGCG